MTQKKLLSQVSSSLTLSTLVRSASSSSFATSSSDDRHADGPHGIEVKWDGPGRGGRKSDRPLSSYVSKHLSSEDHNDEEKNNPVAAVLTARCCCGPATRLVQAIPPLWRKRIAVLAVVGLLCASISLVAVEVRNNGKDNDSSNLSNGMSGGNDNSFDESGNGAGGTPELPEDDQEASGGYGNNFDDNGDGAGDTPELPEDDQEAAPSMAPVVVADGDVQSSGTDTPLSETFPTDALPTTSPSFQAVEPPSPTTTSPSAVTNLPTSSPSFFVPPPTELPTVDAVSVPAIPTDPPSNDGEQPPPTDPTATSAPSSAVAATPPQGESVVLYPNESLEPGVFRSSPNEQYQVGLTAEGDFVLVQQQDGNVIWSSGTSGGANCRLFMQTDGSLLVRNGAGASIWTAETHGYPGARLVVDDAGQVTVKTETGTALWLDGIPRGKGYETSDFQSASNDLAFPVRGAFYYPWYPQTWFIGDHQAHYDAALGMYSSSDPEVAAAHIQAMDYAHIDLSIASWWGPDTHLDRARLTMLMDETVAQNSPLKWSVYHEDESINNPTADQLRSDLDYLKKWFAWHETWAHVDGLPVIFVYNEAGCGIADRWAEASRGEWHVVLKLFPGFEDCVNQPGDWHQYGVGMDDGTIHNEGYSFVMSPGFWKADTDVPLVPRVGKETWCNNARRMVESGEPYQLIVSFNEAGEGTLIEPSPDWESDSGYGFYLDCLHEYH